MIIFRIILKIFEIYIAIYHYNISIIFEEESKIRMPFDNDICYLQLFISVIYLIRGSLALKRYGTPPFCANTVNQLSFTCENFSGGSQRPRRCEYFSPQTSLCLMVLIPRSETPFSFQISFKIVCKMLFILIT